MVKPCDAVEQMYHEQMYHELIMTRNALDHISTISEPGSDIERHALKALSQLTTVPQIYEEEVNMTQSNKQVRYTISGNREKSPYLTFDSIYTVEEESSVDYIIAADDGISRFFPKYWFDQVKKKEPTLKVRYISKDPIGSVDLVFGRDYSAVDHGTCFILNNGCCYPHSWFQIVEPTQDKPVIQEEITMKVRCNTGQCVFISYGKEYQVIQEDIEDYKIYNNLGTLCTYPKKYFDIVKEDKMATTNQLPVNHPCLSLNAEAWADQSAAQLFLYEHGDDAFDQMIIGRDLRVARKWLDAAKVTHNINNYDGSHVWFRAVDENKDKGRRWLHVDTAGNVVRIERT